jgi:hypothetical protein
VSACDLAAKVVREAVSRAGVSADEGIATIFERVRTRPA